MQITVYSKDTCSFCDKAKALLDKHNFQYEVKNIVNPHVKEELLDRFPTARTVPQIFFDNAHIGGYTELKSYLEQTF